MIRFQRLGRLGRLGSIFTSGLLISILSSCGNSSPAAQPGLKAGTPGTAAPVSNATVSIPQGAMGQGPAAFGVNPLVIPAGSMVTWTNNDSIPHTTTSSTGVWDSGTLNPGQSFSFTFNTPGTFPYFCSIHGQASMSGSIQETAAASPSPSISPSVSPSSTPSAAPSISPASTPNPTSVPPNNNPQQGNGSAPPM